MNDNQAYKISIPHYYSLEYTENTHTMTVDIDFRDKEPHLYYELIHRWNSPYEKESISDQKREEIFNNIYMYLTKDRGFSVECRPAKPNTY